MQPQHYLVCALRVGWKKLTRVRRWKCRPAASDVHGKARRRGVRIAGRLPEFFAAKNFSRILTGVLSIFAPASPRASSFPQVCFLYWQQFRRRLEATVEKSFARKEMRERASEPFRWTPIGSGHRRAGADERCISGERPSYIARQQKGHDGFRASSQMLAAGVGGRRRPTFFVPAPFARSVSPERRVQALLACAPLSGYHCVIFKSGWPPRPSSPSFEQLVRTR